MVGRSIAVILAVVLTIAAINTPSLAQQPVSHMLALGARARGMGGSYTAVAEGAGALYWNPAGLSRADARWSAEWSYAHPEISYADNTFYGVTIAARLSERWGAAATFSHFNYSKTAWAGDPDSPEARYHTPSENAPAAGFGVSISDHLSIGVAVKYASFEFLPDWLVSQSGAPIDNTVSGWTADIGVLATTASSLRETGPEFRFGLVVANLGPDLDLDTISDEQNAPAPPRIVRAGLSAILRGRDGHALLAAEFSKVLSSDDDVAPFPEDPTFGAGIELARFIPRPPTGSGTAIRIAGRFGYIQDALRDENGLTFGGGLGIVNAKGAGFTIDYGSSPVEGKQDRPWELSVGLTI